MTVENISWSISMKECCRPSAGVEPATSWSPVGRRIQLSHRGLRNNTVQLHVVIEYIVQYALHVRSVSSLTDKQIYCTVILLSQNIFVLNWHSELFYIRCFPLDSLSKNCIILITAKQTKCLEMFCFLFISKSHQVNGQRAVALNGKLVSLCLFISPLWYPETYSVPTKPEVGGICSLPNYNVVIWKVKQQLLWLLLRQTKLKIIFKVSIRL